MKKKLLFILLFTPIICFSQQEKNIEKQFKLLFKSEKPKNIRWVAHNKEDMYFENDTLIFFRNYLPEDVKIITWNFSSSKYFYQNTGGYRDGVFFMSSYAPPKNLHHKLKIIKQKENTYIKVFYDNKLETTYKLLDIEFLEDKDYKVILVRQNLPPM